jgi:hypothetical protein
MDILNDLRLPRTSIEAASQKLSRVTLRDGAIKKKPAKAGRWKKGAQARTTAARRSSQTVVFDLKGECKGDIEDIWLIAKPLYEAALAEGNIKLAKAVVDKMKAIPLERQLKRLERIAAKALAE